MPPRRKSEVDRIGALQGFDVLRAPFAGIVTQRYVDVGALMPAPTNATQSAQPLVDIADTTRVRVVVYLGQRDAVGVRLGDALSVVRDDDPLHPIAGRVTQIPHELDPRTRTMWVECDLDNPTGKFYPGVYVTVVLDVAAPAGVLIPSAALALQELARRWSRWSKMAWRTSPPSRSRTTTARRRASSRASRRATRSRRGSATRLVDGGRVQHRSRAGTAGQAGHTSAAQGLVVKWLVVLLVPSAALAEPVEFHDAIRRAIEHNPDRQVALEEIARVEGLLTQATSALLPQLGLAGSYTRLEGDRVIQGRRAFAASSVIAQIGVTAPIVDLRAYAELQAGERHRRRDRGPGRRATKRDGAIATARAYFTAYTAARLVEISQHVRDAAQIQVDYVRDRRKGGVSSELELARAEAELAIDEAQIATATAARVRAEEALGVIMGSDRPVSPSGDPELGEPHDGPGIASRADVIASRRNTEAMVWSRRHDWLDWVPTLRLTGDRFVDAPTVEPIPWRGYEDVLLTLTVPLYDGGYRHRRPRAARRAGGRGAHPGGRDGASGDLGGADRARDRDRHPAGARCLRIAAQKSQLALEEQPPPAIAQAPLRDLARGGDRAADRTRYRDARGARRERLPLGGGARPARRDRRVPVSLARVLYQPLTFKSGARMPNRIALAAMTNQQSNADGTLSEDEYAWLARAAPMAASRMIATCAAYVALDGKAWPGRSSASIARRTCRA